MMIAMMCTLLLGFSAQSSKVQKPEAAPKPTEHEVVNVEGWKVHLDRRLRQAKNERLGKRALGLLEAQLRVIAATLPETKVNRLKRVAIQLDLNHGKLVSPQYHPSAGWLKDNGYSEALAQRVHLPDAQYFVAARFQHEQPSAVLHELAHAYHDQVLKFDNPEIKAAWQAAKKSGRFDSVLHINGRTEKHYATTNPQEFFAEMTESFLGHNDFFPFNAGELKKAEPEIAALMEKVWLKP